MPRRDPFKRLDERAKEAGKLQETKRNLDSFKPKGPGKTHPIAARVPLDLYERLQAAEERLGIDRSNRGRFYAFLLAHALDELDAGRLEVPRREKADL